MGFTIVYRVCSSVYEIADLDPQKNLLATWNWKALQKPIDPDHASINEYLGLTHEDRNLPYVEFCNRTDIVLYLYEDGAFT